MLALMIALAAPVVSATVGVAITASNPTPVAGGAAFAYTITLTNNDTAAPATNVVMTLPLPTSVTFQNISVVENSPPAPPPPVNRGFFSCSTPAVGENGLVSCSATSFPASTVQIPTTATITIVAQVAPATASGVRIASARVVTGGLQVVANAQLNIKVEAPLSISKSASASANRGSNLVYSIDVFNSGNSTALIATIVDTLPVTTSFVSMTGTGPFHDGCVFEPGINALSCAGVAIPRGHSIITLVVKTSAATPLGTLTNTATIATAGTGTIVTGTANASTTITP